jgi:hypothetical protein
MDELINALSEMDCGDNGCLFVKDKHGMRTNGGCRCLKELPTKLQLAIKKIWWHHTNNQTPSVEEHKKLTSTLIMEDYYHRSLTIKPERKE